MIAKKTTSDCKNKGGAHPPHHPQNLPLYRPISLLALISKLFEKVVYQQIEDFANKIYHQNSVDLEKDIQHNMHF